MSSGSYEKGELTHQFIIAVKRGPYHAIATDPKNNAPIRALAHLYDAVFDNGSVYMQLKTPEGSTSSFFYDNRVPHGIRFGAGAGLAFSVFTAYMAGVPIPNVIYYPLSFFLPLMAATHGPGEITRPRVRPSYHLGMSFNISAEKYGVLASELKGLSEKKSEGVYSILLNNCSTYALRFSRDHGFNVPTVLWPTPRNLANQLERMISSELQPGF